MTARVLDGRAIAAEVVGDVTRRAAQINSNGAEPHLVFVSVGDSPEADLYASRLEKIGSRSGILVTRRRIPQDTPARDFEAEIAAANADKSVDGILVDMPLPAQLRTVDLSPCIDPRKDVDGVTVQSAGRLYLGKPSQIPSTAVAMMQILASSDIDATGKRAVVIGRSSIVGHPVAELLLHANATVTVTHTKTRDLAEVTRQAEILMVGSGQPRLVTSEMISPGVVIVDAGTNVTSDGLVGDVDFQSCRAIASAITPVPGGVGPITNAVLLRAVVSSAEQRLD